jgi:hypothetical protein
VVYIQAAIKRGFLRQIYEQARNSTVYLNDALLAFQGSIFSPSFKTGRILVNTSGGGQSAYFEVPQLGRQYTVDQIFALSEELLEIYSDVVAQLQAATPSFDPNASAANQTTTFNTMMDDDRLQGVRTQMGDFTGLRIPVTR